MLPEISYNSKNILVTGIKPFLRERFFSIHTLNNVINPSFGLNTKKNNDKLTLVQEKLNTSKLSFAAINKVKPVFNTRLSSTATFTKNSIELTPTFNTKINNNSLRRRNPSTKKIMKKVRRRNTHKKYINDNSYFPRQLEESKIEELLLANDTQISVVSGPSSCGKTKLIQHALQTLAMNYIILETNDFKNMKTLYNSLKFQISPSLPKNKNKRRYRNGKSRSNGKGKRRWISQSSFSSKKDTINEEAILDLLKSIPEEIPIIIDDAFSLFNYSNESILPRGEKNSKKKEKDDELSLKIHPIIFEWIYDCLERDKKLNMILVSSNPLVEYWTDINIPKEIVRYCPIGDLTFDEAQDFYSFYLQQEGIDGDTIDELKFEDIYPITGTRLSIIRDFIQEYIHRSSEDFNDLDFSTLNKIYHQLKDLLKERKRNHPQLLKRIMAIMVSESNRGYVEEEELEFVFHNNPSFNMEGMDKNKVNCSLHSSRSSSKKIKNKKVNSFNSEDFWDVIALLIENHILHRTMMMEYTNSLTKAKKAKSVAMIKRPILFPENQCVLYAMDKILKENNIYIDYLEE